MGEKPILPGFHPDPSICRVGEEYFIANSSFEYVPGVPIHRSADLVTWELVGHALPDAEEIASPEGAEGASSGVFAPTLRHHDGRFWLTTTTIGRIREGQLITHAEHPDGPWSEPVRVPDTIGIDPDLAWDDDGRCLLTWRSMSPPGICQVEIDPETGERFGEARMLWPDGGLADTEGPHLIRRGHWWYLIVAEGGTGLGHGVSVARSRDPRGPFEQHQANPIFSHRSTGHPVQATGHADLVERADGGWAMVFLGIRQNGSFPPSHVNGRETFLAGVDWVEDWPVVDEDVLAGAADPAGFIERFEALGARWVSPSVARESFSHVDDGLVLAAGRDADSAEQTRVLCSRVSALEWDATAAVDADACLSVRIDAGHWYGAEIVGGVLRARAVSAPFDKVLAQAALPVGARLALRARARDGYHSSGVGPDTVSIGYEADGEFTSIAEIDGRYVSTELAGGFTGRMIGLEAVGGEARFAEVVFAPR
ncbi:glycoside hydrolase family 43 protein [Microbacterium halotolerans]|uniref:glycoside hydrolase family 43 protein n=1 Tax=Microbacterium halotolerans TaxID=246613 RepID=UPI000E6AB68A|nr:glycoside hydrolase family 43 protein [Microbacterium halotolerans]